jgi:MFS family permease
MLLILMPIYVIFNSLNNTNIPALFSVSASSEIQGEVLGINASVQALGQSFPPIIGGIISALFGYWSPLLAASCVVGVAYLIFALGYKTKAARINA